MVESGDRLADNLSQDSLELRNLEVTYISLE